LRIFLRFFFSPSTGAAALAVFFAAFAPSADLAGALDAVEAGALPAVDAGLGAMDVLGWVAGGCGGGSSKKRISTNERGTEERVKYARVSLLLFKLDTSARHC
jgi:hypothetical protein